MRNILVKVKFVIKTNVIRHMHVIFNKYLDEVNNKKIGFKRFIKRVPIIQLFFLGPFCCARTCTRLLLTSNTRKKLKIHDKAIKFHVLLGFIDTLSNSLPCVSC